MSKVLVETEVLQAVVDYLSTKPFSEVFQLIGAIQQTTEVMESEPEEETPEPQKKTRKKKADNPDTKDA